jgi:hypothetical protein
VGLFGHGGDSSWRRQIAAEDTMTTAAAEENLFFCFLRNKFNTRGFVIGSRAPHEMPRRSRKEESNKKDMKLVNIFQIKEEEIKKKPLF